MSTYQNKAVLPHRHKKKAMICAIIWTIVYLLLLPFLSYFTLLSLMIFDNPYLSISKGLTIIFTIALIPLSMPVTIILMWSSYACKKYSKTLYFCLIPWLALIPLLILNSILQFL